MLRRVCLITVNPNTQLPVALGNLVSAKTVWWNNLGYYLCPVSGKLAGVNKEHDFVKYPPEFSASLFPSSHHNPFAETETLVVQHCEPEFLERQVLLPLFPKCKTLIVRGEVFPYELGQSLYNHHFRLGDLHIKCTKDSEALYPVLRTIYIENKVTLMTEEETLALKID